MKMLPVLALSGLYTVIGLVALICGADNSPSWYQAASIASIVPAMTAGALLCLRRKSAPQPLTHAVA
jgi:hypothetical protein